MDFFRWSRAGTKCLKEKKACRCAENDKRKTKDQHPQDRSKTKELFVEFNDGHFEQKNDDKPKRQDSVKYGPQRSLVSSLDPITNAEIGNDEQKNEKENSRRFYVSSSGFLGWFFSQPFPLW